MVYEANVQYLDSMKIVYEKEEFLFPLYKDIKTVLRMCTRLHSNEDLFQPTVEWDAQNSSICLLWQYKNEEDDKTNYYNLACIFSALKDNRSCKIELSKGINKFNTYQELVILYKEQTLLTEILESIIKKTTNELFNN